MIYRKRRMPTVTLERHILHYLLKSKVILQGRMNSIREVWFTSDERFSIFHMLRKHYERSHAVLTQTQFDVSIEEEFSGEQYSSLRESIRVEYRLILELKPEDEADVIISRLNDSILACEAEDLLISAHERLVAGDVEGALTKLKLGSLELHRSEEKKKAVSLWMDTAEWEEEQYNRREYPERYTGIPTGFKKFDDNTGGLFPAELTVIFGLSGKGKSTLMKQIAVNVRRRGYNVLHCGNEEDEYQMRTKYTSVETGVKYSLWKRGKYADADMKLFRQYRDNARQTGKEAGQLFIYSFPQQTDATMIERQLVEFKEQGIKIDLVIVDYLDLMSSIKRAYNENDEGGRITMDLRQIAINFHVPVIVATQAGEQASKQENKERPFLTASDVFGTKRKVHSANTLMGIVNQTATVNVGERSDDELKTHRLVICVPKNRDGPVFTFRLLVQVETGQVFEDNSTDAYADLQEQQAQAIMRDSMTMEEASEIPPVEQQKRISEMLTDRAEKFMETLNTPMREPGDDTEEIIATTSMREPGDDTEEIMEQLNTPTREPGDDTEEIMAENKNGFLSNEQIEAVNSIEPEPIKVPISNNSSIVSDILKRMRDESW